MIRHSLWILLLLALAACTSSSPPSSGTAHTGTSATAAATHVPWSSALKAEQRARNVQKIINQHANKQRAQIDKETH